MWQKYIIAGASNKHGVIGGPFGRDGCALGSLELHISFSLPSWNYNNMVFNKIRFYSPIEGAKPAQESGVCESPF